MSSGPCEEWNGQTKEHRENPKGREVSPQERVVVRDLWFHFHAVHDLLPDIKSRDDPGDHEPQPPVDEVGARAPPSTRTEHVASWVQPFLGLGIDGFEEAFGLE